MNRVENSAYFPVTDVQGNIRGYANTSGVQSAYAYYPYGTLIDLAHDDAEDSRRWQSKEFDSDINKYYFGARFYDPLFGLWLTPDPAGQFANPYTYGGDPLNYIDPNGESLTAAIAIGAAVGAAIGASVSAVNCSGASEVGCGKAIAQGVAMGALKGAASAAAGYGAGIAVSGIAEAAGAARTGYAALEMGSSAMSAAAQGAAVQTGFVSGASAWASSVVSSAFDRGNEWYRFDKSFGEDLKNGGFDWGASITTTYFMEKRDIEENARKKYKLSDKWVGININGFDVVKYDHSNRNMNQPMGRDWKNKEEFIAYANDNNLSYGTYGDEASAFHNPDINEKMWMAEKGKEPVGIGRNIKYGESEFSSKRSGLPSYIPSIEGVFNKRNGSNAGASYNYGNNHISHLAFDILPWLIME